MTSDHELARRGEALLLLLAMQHPVSLFPWLSLFKTIQVGTRGRVPYQVTSYPATDEAEGDDGELVKLVGGRLGQDADCMWEQRPCHKHAHGHKAHQRSNHPEQDKTLNSAFIPAPCLPHLAVTQLWTTH